MDKQEVTLLVLLDLRAAFNTVNHKILVNILKSDFGILKWFRSYLTGRIQHVIVVKKHLPTVIKYTDDSQLYVSFRPDSFAAQDQAIKANEISINDVKALLVSQWLMFNDSKTVASVI